MKEEMLSIMEKAEKLPEIRNALLEIVNEINMVLKASRGLKGPRKSPKKSRDYAVEFARRKAAKDAGHVPKKRKSSGGESPLDVITNAPPKKRAYAKRAKTKLLPELPENAQEIPGIAATYQFAPGVGMISLVNGNVRLMRFGSNRCWNVRGSKGEKVNLSLGALQKALKGVNLGL